MHHSTVIDDSGDLSNPDRCTRRLYETAGRVALGLADKLLRDLDPETLIAAAMLRPLEEREAAALLSALTSSPPAIRGDRPAFQPFRDKGKPPEQALSERIRELEARLPDATTAALERKVAEREAALAPESWAGKLCPKCGRELLINGMWRNCTKCSKSWRMPNRVQPESPWVPDSKPEREQPAPKRSIETLMREVFLEGSALPIPSHPALVAAVLDLMLTMRDHARRGHDFVTLRLSEVLP
jgi:hypothetical protein